MEITSLPPVFSLFKQTRSQLFEVFKNALKGTEPVCLASSAEILGNFAYFEGIGGQNFFCGNCHD